jgi:hypothetical protein
MNLFVLTKKTFQMVETTKDDEIIWDITRKSERTEWEQEYENEKELSGDIKIRKDNRGYQTR